MNLAKTLLAGAAVLTLATTAEAVQLNGSFSLQGGGQQRVVSGMTVTGLDFTNIGSAQVSGPASNVTGSFTGLLQPGDLATFVNELDFSSSAGLLYTVSGFGGDVTFTITDATITPDTPANFVIFEAEGEFTAPGFDTTPGSLVYSGNEIGTGADSTFSFSTSQVATPVAEPATLGLLGMGLAGLGVALRRRRQA